MEFRRTLLSFLLLFAYTIGFAHDFIPHYHIEDIHFGVGNKEFHSHLSENNDVTNNVNHGEHLDAGIYNYLICVFSEANHSNHDDVNADAQYVINSVVSHNDIPFFEIHFLGTNEIGLSSSSVKVSTKPFRDNSTCLSTRSNRRGPPLFS